MTSSLWLHERTGTYWFLTWWLKTTSASPGRWVLWAAVVVHQQATVAWGSRALKSQPRSRAGTVHPVPATPVGPSAGPSCPLKRRQEKWNNVYTPLPAPSPNFIRSSRATGLLENMFGQVHKRVVKLVWDRSVKTTNILTHGTSNNKQGDSRTTSVLIFSHNNVGKSEPHLTGKEGSKRGEWHFGRQSEIHWRRHDDSYDFYRFFCHLIIF